MPSPETVQKMLVQLRKGAANYAYFFSKVDSPEWIEPLTRHGFFSSPPDPVADESGVMFPFWPESQYLARVAGQAPENVFAVMEKIPSTDNVRVREDLAEAALQLPARMAAKWARRELNWIKDQPHLYFVLPEAYGKLATYLASNGQPHAALELAEELLAVRSTEGARDVTARCDGYHYERVVKELLPVLTSRRPDATLAMVCRLMDSALAGESGPDRDYSYIWRPAVEPHSQNRRLSGVRDVLVDALRDVAVAAVSAGRPVEEIRGVLESYRRPVFRRVALHVAAENPSDAASRTLALDRRNFYDVGVRHEYARLVRLVFGDLADAEQKQLLAWVEAGPERDTDDDTAPDLREKQDNYWRVGRLLPLRGQLPEDWESRLTTWLDDLGEPEHPEFPAYMKRWVGPTSPVDLVELADMTPAEVARFVKGWTPSEEQLSPQPEGLGRVLQKAVERSPKDYVASLGEFEGVHPTYARALVQALSEAIKRDEQICQPATLNYLQWIVEQPRGEDPQDSGSGRLDLDPHWGWARQAVARFLSEALQRDAFDIELRGEVWGVLQVTASDPDPSPSDGSKSSMDPATLSINSTRGVGFHAVVHYAMWVRRAVPDEDWRGMESLHEVRELLEAGLDPEREPSPAVRSVYGRWLPWLVLLDSVWARDHVDAMFPPAEPELRDAAWVSFLTFCSPYNDVFPLVEHLYAQSVQRLPDGLGSEVGWVAKPAEKLGEHLVILLGWGLVGWDDGGSIVKTFFHRASTEDASRVVSFLGHSLVNSEDDVPEDYIRRFRRLWEALFLAAMEDGGPSREILSRFGWWFASGRFETEWAFRQLERVVELTGAIDPDFMVMERLAELVETHPRRSFELLRQLVKADVQGWNILGWKDSAKKIILAALRSDDTKEDAVSFVHELGARGHHQFRELLSDSTTSG